MFGFKDRLSRSVLKTLDSIDLEYMRAYQVKTVRALQPFMSDGCLQKVLSFIHGFQDRYFADTKFRNTEWQVQEREGEFYTVLKKVTFDKIKVTSTVRISAAEDYEEIWKLSINGNKVVIMDIIQC